MGLNDSPDDDFALEAERFGLKEHMSYPLKDKETEYQRDLSQRWIESYPHGLEEVDVWKHLNGLTHPEIYHTAMATEALMLSSFCRGQCRECGLSAKPYTPKNRQIFALEPLIRFLEKYKTGGAIGKLMLYDASDPLDYPYLLQLLDYLEWDDNYREIKILTSCPSGTEELLEHLLKRDSEKIQLALSVLPSTSSRLQASGAWDMVVNDSRKRIEESFFAAQRWKNINPEPIGRNHSKGILSSGFYCGDMMVMTPHLGPCCAEYHIASDLYPTERRLVSVKKARRVYLHNEFFSVQPSPGFNPGPRLYVPESNYADLDTRIWHTETALRHLVAYIYSVFENVCGERDYSPIMLEHLKKILKALKEGEFVLPEDPKELEFYRKLIPKLLEEGKRNIAEFPKGVMYMSSGFVPERYEALWNEIEQIVKDYQEVILGESKD